MYLFGSLMQNRAITSAILLPNAFENKIFRYSNTVFKNTFFNAMCKVITKFLHKHLHRRSPPLPHTHIHTRTYINAHAHKWLPR